MSPQRERNVICKCKLVTFVKRVESSNLLCVANTVSDQNGDAESARA